MINKLSDDETYEELMVYHFNADYNSPNSNRFTFDEIKGFMETVPKIKGCANIAIVGDIEIERI